MIFFKRLLKQEFVKGLGDGGLTYFDGTNDYYIDSNNYFGWKVKTVTIFRDIIKKVVNKDFMITNSETYLNDRDKERIALVVKKILEKDKIEVKIEPPLSRDVHIK